MKASRNWQRDEYVYAQRKCGRTYRGIGQELGVSVGYVRQLYVRACRERRQKYFQAHPEARAEWVENPNDPKWDDLPEK